MEAVGKLFQTQFAPPKLIMRLHTSHLCAAYHWARRSFDEPVWHCWQLRKHKLSNLSFTAWTHIHYSLLPALPPHSERKFSVRHFTDVCGPAIEPRAHCRWFTTFMGDDKTHSRSLTRSLAARFILQPRAE
jgi:hypothetical protein